MTCKIRMLVPLILFEPLITGLSMFLPISQKDMYPLTPTHHFVKFGLTVRCRPYLELRSPWFLQVNFLGPHPPFILKSSTALPSTSLPEAIDVSGSEQQPVT